MVPILVDKSFGFAPGIAHKTNNYVQTFQGIADFRAEPRPTSLLLN